MDLNQIVAKLGPYLEKEARTVYELCADTGLGVSALNNYLKILEAGGRVRRVRGAKKTLWMMSSAPAPSAEEGEVAA